ncbi:ABC transporter ATP-binding protein [Micromonospora cathayae]|uniref:ABC transporter ATP-binding protein n=1 Tax=Micromonospora cathayae TaxID=3028804 RepID=A0ABY7ZK10_9ACTN|nr:ABC transporter ATP-binding protein [Micromonospora sp. HUAS 3]WDZ83329.1 ABC transporter ATP-binding protein [Micromonospora sp. HUAS 3]
MADLVTSTPVVSVRGLSKVYGTRTGTPVVALEEVSFDIAEGEFVSILGPSGCGKSTLLRIVAGLTDRTGGTVDINAAGAEPGADVGLMFQQAVLLPWKTVEQNVALPGIVAGRRFRDVRSRARDLIEMVGLDGFAEKYPGELSGGMQQRAALARSLLQDPRLLLLDEPFGALDAMTRDQMNLEVERVRQRTGKTILLVTHSIAEAVFLSDRIIVMTGRPGTIREIVEVTLHRPRELDVTGSAAFGAYTNQIRKLLDQPGVAHGSV